VATTLVDKERSDSVACGQARNERRVSLEDHKKRQRVNLEQPAAATGGPGGAQGPDSTKIIDAQEAKMEDMQRTIDLYKVMETNKNEIIANKEEIIQGQGQTSLALAGEVAALKELVSSQKTVIALLKPGN
jgi:hypothetical protein